LAELLARLLSNIFTHEVHSVNIGGHLIRAWFAASAASCAAWRQCMLDSVKAAGLHLVAAASADVVRLANMSDL
jgi:hypothetical protein